jgi:vancomycin permeability regulator SanA
VLLVLVAFALAGGALTAYTTFRIWQVGQQDTRQHVDAIVVLGAAQYNGRPSPVLQARLDHAIELYNDGYAPYLITTGGKMEGDNYTEAQTGFIYATKRGVPAAAILMEDTGSTTLESMQHVRAVFDAHGLHTALFVSDRSHMLRVLRLAQDQGIEGWASPTTTSPDDTSANLHYKSMVHELGAFAQYVFINADPGGDGVATP